MSSHGASFDLSSISIERLQQLRAKFFTPHPQGLADYWDSLETLAAYDATLGRRIAWKWESVVAAIQAQARINVLPFERVLDWGCGSGAAITTLLKSNFLRQGEPNFKVVLHDRSGRAMAFASERVQVLGVNRVETTATPMQHVDNNTLLLVSHVLTELNAQSLLQLEELAAKAGGVVWVEPGTPFCGGRLVEIRERFRENGFLPILPCPHVGRCGLAGSAQQDWCHFFAEPPCEVFQDSNWSKLAKVLKLDLRSLPVSFLFLARQDRVARTEELAPTSVGLASALVLGRPKVLKGHSELVVCEESGVHTLNWQHKRNRALAKSLEKPEFLRSFGTDNNEA